MTFILFTILAIHTLALGLGVVRFEPRDLWVGVYWNLRTVHTVPVQLDIYICLLPTLPFHIQKSFDVKGEVK